MTLAQDMMAAVDGMQEELVTGRRDLHRYPEPGWTEFRTAAKVAKALKELGYGVAMGREAVAEAAMMGRPSAAVLQAAQERALAYRR